MIKENIINTDKKNPPLTYLKKLRKESGFTIQEMAKKLNMSSSMYGYVENGDKRLSYEIATKIADIFDTTPDKLFYDDYEYYFKEIII